MRSVAGLLACVAALGAAGAGTPAPGVVEARSCAQVSDGFNVQILGESSWGFGLDNAHLPSKRTIVVVWSRGGPAASGGVAVFGWITNARSAFRAGCSVTSAARRQTPGALRPPIRVKDGWFWGRKFACFNRGRLRLVVRDIAGGKRITVRMDRTGVLVAQGEVTRGGGWLRASKRCDERER